LKSVLFYFVTTQTVYIVFLKFLSGHILFSFIHSQLMQSSTTGRIIFLLCTVLDLSIWADKMRTG